MNMSKSTLSPWQLFHSVRMEQSYTGRAGYRVSVQRVTRLSKLPQGNEKLM